MMRYVFGALFVVTALTTTAYAQSSKVPTRAEVGSDRWGRDIGDALKLTNASIEIGDRIELRKQGYRASRLIGEVSGWPDADAWRVSRIHCSRTAQALMNYISDVEKGTARGLVSARAEAATMREASEKCAVALNRLK